MNRSEAKAAREAALAKANRAHDKYVVKTYQLEPGEYFKMLAAQDGRCAICLRVARTRRLAVDHDHKTGQVRGLLCYRCNHYLGQWESEPIIVENLINYLHTILAGMEAPSETVVSLDALPSQTS